MYTLSYLSYLLGQAWHWLAGTGVNLAIILVVAMLVPRVGRLVERYVERDVEAKADKEETKNTLAYAGVLIYIGQIVAYFLLSVAFLQQLGFSLAGAAIPATVASAAIGFGAQSIIADFLAGFFILTEKQYGVGDWVRFAGNGVEVEGTVIQITMRATQIRTLAQETVIIPNSTARVSINTSNYWSRAVIVMPVPLLGSDSPTEAADRAEAATRRALADESVADDVIGELDVQPAVSVDPPATVGMPWTVDMRFMIQVEAGTQWAVERAVRMALLEEFWDEYGSAPTTTGELSNQVRRPAATRASASDASADTVTTPVVVPRDRRPDDESASEAEERKKNAESSTPPADRAGADGSDPAALSMAGARKDKADKGIDKDIDEAPDKEEREDGGDPTTVLIPAVTPGSTPTGLGDADVTETAVAGADTRGDGAADDEEGTDKDEDKDDRWLRLKRVLSVNGRFRPSSTVLVLILLVLLFIRSLSVSGETADGERISGPLAPPATSSSVVPDEDEGPAPDPDATPAPTPTQPQGIQGNEGNQATPAPTPTPTQNNAPTPAPQNATPQQTTAPAPAQAPATTGATAPAQESPTAGALN